MTELHLNFAAIERAIRDAAADGLVDSAESIMTESDRHVPIEHGRLDKSSRVVVDRQHLEAAVTYDTAYAVIQHEALDEHHDPGRHAKFLENAGNAKRTEVPAAVAARIRRALGT